jgi:hypothetical protein
VSRIAPATLGALAACVGLVAALLVHAPAGALVALSTRSHTPSSPAR